MSTLIILGNTNQFTFANSIVAAHYKSLEIFQEPIETIFAIHSAASYSLLHQRNEWLAHLRGNGIPQDALVHRVVEIEPTMKSVERFADYIETIIKGTSENSDIIVDLTNGTTLHKTLLSTAAYILDLNRLYIIDIIRLSELTDERGFLPAGVLKSSYIPAPDSTQLDNIAYLNLVEVVRYKRIIETHTQNYFDIDPDSSDEEFFRNNLIHSIQLKLRGDRQNKTDRAIYRIASSSISASVEDLVRILIDKFVMPDSLSGADRKTFGQKLRIIRAKIEREVPPHFDLEFFRRFNDFMLYLRNSTTHKGKLLTDVEKFKADLSVKMSLPFIEFYTNIVYPQLARDEQGKSPRRIRKLTHPSLSPNDTFYFGLDGDDTGTILEEFLLYSRNETMVRRLSKSVEAAIREIVKLIRKHHPDSSVIFAAGDDLLFRGCFAEDALREMQGMYQDITSGLTCSIGYGRSFKEVYLALKLAKAEPGKNSIVGIEIE